jgi:hypothetical protein
MRKNSITLGNNKSQNTVSNSNEILDNNNLGSSFVRNNNSQDSVSNSNNSDSVFEKIGINTQIEQNSSEVIRVKKRSLSQASDSSHINLKHKGLNEEFNNQNDIQEESSNQNDTQNIVENLHNSINDKQEEINRLIDEAWQTIVDIDNKKETMEDSILPIPEHDLPGIMIRVREKIDTHFSNKTIAYDDTFDSTLGTNPNNPNSEVRINVFRDAENIINPTRLPDSEFNPGVIRSIENTEESSNEVQEHINANSIDLMRVDFPELYTQYPEHPNDHVLTVESTDDDNSGIDPEDSDDYDIESEHSDNYDIESEHSDDENIGMVDLFTDKSLEEIEFSDNLRLDRFEYDNYLVLMQGIDNLNYRTVFEDIREYLDYVNILKNQHIEMLRNIDLMDISIYNRVTHEIFEALLYIAQFN